MVVDAATYTCGDCNKSVSEADRICPHCGADVSEVEDAPTTTSPAPTYPNSALAEEYPALRLIIKLYKLFSVFALGAGLFIGYFLWDGVSPGASRPIYLFFLDLAVTSISSTTLWALAESITVFLDIERNTRQNSQRQK